MVKDSGGNVVDGPGLGNSGVIVGDVHVHPAPPSVAVYQTEVERFCPDELLDRDDELERLSAFCTSDDGAAYQVWRASPWAGKSALLAWFASKVPPKNVRLVPYFISGRFGTRNRREAFLAIMIEELARLLDRPPPAVNPYLSDNMFLALLADAANLCRRNGERLVLLVDGLDEDAGVTADAGAGAAASIAAVLPAEPPDGVRIVVSARLNPPIPGDVPDHHPLRDEAIVELLTVSPHAQVVKHSLRMELDRLLGDSVGRRLLSLVVAAGDGLTLGDLAWLTKDISRYQISRHLGAVTGRSYHPGRAMWQPADDEHVYTLGHQELHDNAAANLDNTETGDARGRLHAWAETFEAGGWPADTPEYLLRGYFVMLGDTGDHARRLRLAGNTRRWARLREASGNDNAALAEITAVMAEHAARSSTDLPVVARLAMYRDFLLNRAGSVARGLPSVLARLGRPARAEGLARRVSDRDGRLRELIDLARTVIAAGDIAHGLELAGTVEAMLSGYDDVPSRAQATIGLIEVLVAAGDKSPAVALIDRVMAMLHTTGDDYWNTPALHHPHPPASGYLSFRPDRWRAGARLALVAPAVAVGDRQRAADLITEAQRTMKVPVIATWPEECQLVIALAEIGDIDRAGDVITTAPPFAAGPATLALVRWLLARGRIDEASRFASAVPDRCPPDLYRYHGIAVCEVLTARAATDPARANAYADGMEKQGTLADLVPFEWATALLAIGRPESARKLVDEALTQDSGRPQVRMNRTELVTAPARLAARLGDAAAAVRLALRHTDAVALAQTLTELAEIFLDTGRPDDAARLASQAEAVGRAIPEIDNRNTTILRLAPAVAMTGDIAYAVGIAETIADAVHRASALAEILRHVPTTDPAAAAALIDSIVAIAETLKESSAAQILTATTDNLVNRGTPDLALSLIPRIVPVVKRAPAVTTLLPASDHSAEQTMLFGHFNEILEQHRPDHFFDTGVKQMLKTAYQVGHAALAERGAHRLPNARDRADALLTLAQTAHEAGNTLVASQMAAEAERAIRALPDDDLSPGFTRALLLRDLTDVVAQTGDMNQASRLAYLTEGEAPQGCGFGVEAWLWTGALASAWRAAQSCDEQIRDQVRSAAFRDLLGREPARGITAARTVLGDGEPADAYAVAEAGFADVAELVPRLIASVSDEASRSRMWGDASLAAAGRGRFDHARAWVRNVEPTSLRAEYLGLLTAGDNADAALTADRNDALNMLSDPVSQLRATPQWWQRTAPTPSFAEHLCSGAPWTDAAQALAAAAPEALLQMADEYVRDDWRDEMAAWESQAREWAWQRRQQDPR
ncbi:hypothetical protein [Nucisporomicrobium flavum]|uniref:hypothetical protein n=1 Tax=Nucisporomicrobium flavum TaxID=2785915 RepID=UPI0018F3F7C3|nr:hypothetical protein [Nucisporomicrobium flavum]